MEQLEHELVPIWGPSSCKVRILASARAPKHSHHSRSSLPFELMRTCSVLSNKQNVIDRDYKILLC